MPDVELLERVMQHIEDNPYQHDQSLWFCGTSACFGGWTCLLSGWEQERGYNSFVQKDGRSRCVRTVAAELLGLDETQANILFDGGMGIPALRAVVNDIVNGEPLREREEYWPLDWT